MSYKVLDIQEASDVYELMDQTQLLRLKQAFEYDLAHNIDTEKSVLFASERIAIIDRLIEEGETI